MDNDSEQAKLEQKIREQEVTARREWWQGIVWLLALSIIIGGCCIDKYFCSKDRTPVVEYFIRGH